MSNCTHKSHGEQCYINGSTPHIAHKSVHYIWFSDNNS